MYEYFIGKFAKVTATQVAIDVNGVGYDVNISLNTFAKIKDLHEGKIYIHLAVKEDAHTLYGFADDDERKMFRHLITVNGVGTNTARMILSSITPNELQMVISGGNVAVLQKVKGIGAKTAQKIIIDLKDKVIKDGPSGSTAAGTIFVTSSARGEALSALVTLGFARNVAEKAIDTTTKQKGDNLNVEELIKGALSNL